MTAIKNHPFRFKFMEFKVVDLKLLNKPDLQFNPVPIAEWPTALIDIEENKEDVCIASWHWDIKSDAEISNNLSECAWDALSLRFQYMLCDIVSLDQKSGELSSKLIIYSSYYRLLHCVISYHVDDDLKRPWLSYEAGNILESPTFLGYLYHKWKLRVPLIFSLLIKQVAVRRLGITEINENKLYLCDTDEANYLRIDDLDLFKNVSLKKKIKVINLDRQDQTYASDCLLIYELSSFQPRNELIGDLKKLESNCILIPALLTIWAMADGFSISIKGCDWDIQSIISWIFKILEANLSHLDENTTLKFDKESPQVIFQGESFSEIYQLEIQSPTGRLAIIQKNDDLFCRFLDREMKFVTAKTKQEFLYSCLNYALTQITNKMVSEPEPLTTDHPKYRLVLDSYYHNE